MLSLGISWTVFSSHNKFLLLQCPVALSELTRLFINGWVNIVQKKEFYQISDRVETGSRIFSTLWLEHTVEKAFWVMNQSTLKNHTCLNLK